MLCDMIDMEEKKEWVCCWAVITQNSQTNQVSLVQCIGDWQYNSNSTKTKLDVGFRFNSSYVIKKPDFFGSGPVIKTCAQFLYIYI